MDNDKTEKEKKTIMKMKSAKRRKSRDKDEITWLRLMWGNNKLLEMTMSNDDHLSTSDGTENIEFPLLFLALSGWSLIENGYG